MRTSYKLAAAAICLAAGFAGYGLVTNGRSFVEPNDKNVATNTSLAEAGKASGVVRADSVSTAAGLNVLADGLTFPTTPLSSLGKHYVAFKATSYVNVDPSLGFGVKPEATKSPYFLVIAKDAVYSCIYRIAAQRSDCSQSPATYDPTGDNVTFEVTTSSVTAVFSIVTMKRAVETGVAGNPFIPKNAVALVIASPEDPSGSTRFTRLAYMPRADLLAMNPRDVNGDPISLSGNGERGVDAEGAVKPAVVEKALSDTPKSHTTARPLRCEDSNGEVVFTNSAAGYARCRPLGGQAGSVLEDKAPSNLLSSGDVGGRRNVSVPQREHRIDCPSDRVRLVKQEPVYPPPAIRQGHEGKVVLSLTFGSSGAPVAIEVLESSGFRELDKAAQDSARSWRLNGAACLPSTTAQIRVPVTFDLNRH
ncbi:energy transducer TonB [Luteibacter sp. PPL554]